MPYTRWKAPWTKGQEAQSSAWASLGWIEGGVGWVRVLDREALDRLARGETVEPDAH